MDHAHFDARMSMMNQAMPRRPRALITATMDNIYTATQAAFCKPSTIWDAHSSKTTLILQKLILSDFVDHSVKALHRFSVIQRRFYRPDVELDATSQL